MADLGEYPREEEVHFLPILREHVFGSIKAPEVHSAIEHGPLDRNAEAPESSTAAHAWIVEQSRTKISYK